MVDLLSLPFSLTASTVYSPQSSASTMFTVRETEPSLLMLILYRRPSYIVRPSFFQVTLGVGAPVTMQDRVAELPGFPAVDCKEWMTGGSQAATKRVINN